MWPLICCISSNLLLGRTCNSSYEFMCPNGRCIRQANVCDSQCDCAPTANSTLTTCADEVDCDHYYILQHGNIAFSSPKILKCLIKDLFFLRKINDKLLHEPNFCNIQKLSRLVFYHNTSLNLVYSIHLL